MNLLVGLTLRQTIVTKQVKWHDMAVQICYKSNVILLLLLLFVYCKAISASNA